MYEMAIIGEGPGVGNGGAGPLPRPLSRKRARGANRWRFQLLWVVSPLPPGEGPGERAGASRTAAYPSIPANRPTCAT